MFLSLLIWADILLLSLFNMFTNSYVYFGSNLMRVKWLVTLIHLQL